MESIFNFIDEFIMVLDKENNIKFCNNSLLKRLGFNINELLKENLITFTKGICNLDNDDKISIYDKKNNLIKFTYKLSYNTWNGNEAKILALKEIELYTKSDLEEILENTPLLAWIKDLEGRYIYVNKAYCDKIGLSKNEIIGKRCRDILCEEDAAIIEEEDRKLIEERYSIIDEEKLRLNNKLLLLFISKDIAVDIDGNAKYLYGMALDITENKRLEQEKKELEKEIAAEHIRNEFFNNISHEFKTPINLLLSTTQLMNEHMKNNNISNINEYKVKRYMEIIENNSYRLLKLTDNLIDMTQIDIGNYKLTLENKDIISIVENVILTASDYIGNINSKIIFDTNIEEKIVACDQEKIEKIILNLLSNAIKYSNDSDNEIFVNMKSSENNIKISIKDNGIGIAEDKLQSIFEKFGQEDKSLSRRQEGSGLGLALVKSLVEMHDGTIEVKSKLGEGSEFIITLPYKELLHSEQLRFNICNHSIFEKCMIEFSDIYAII